MYRCTLLFDQQQNHSDKNPFNRYEQLEKCRFRDLWRVIRAKGTLDSIICLLLCGYAIIPNPDNDRESFFFSNERMKNMFLLIMSKNPIVQVIFGNGKLRQQGFTSQIEISRDMPVMALWVEQTGQKRTVVHLMILEAMRKGLPDMFPPERGLSIVDARILYPSDFDQSLLLIKPTPSETLFGWSDKKSDSIWRKLAINGYVNREYKPGDINV
jgi:hypothetical protein